MTAIDLTVVLTTAQLDASLARVLGRLEQQSLLEGVEVLLVVPRALEVDALAFTRGLDTVVVAAEPFETVDRARASGIRAAQGRAVALLEDHAYPSADWTRALVAAHRASDVVAARLVSANHPSSALAWANFELAYGQLVAVAPGHVDDLPSHNTSYLREHLLALDGELPELLERDGGLHARLRAADAVFELVPATLEHLFPSSATASWSLRRDAGRLYAATRARGWSRVRRAVFVVGSPMLPIVRGVRQARAAAAPGRPPAHRAVSALAFLLVADAAGQMLGYARGYGGARDRLARFEEGRLRHVTQRDLALVTRGAGGSIESPSSAGRARRASRATGVPLRVVQLGLGPAGRELHLPALERIPGVEVVAACDPDADARRRVAKGLRTVDDPHEALALGCDVAIVATPPETHGELAAASLATGHHVYVEKPMVTSSGEGKALAALAAAEELLVQVGFAYRYHPLWLRARDALARGVLRPPVTVTARFTTARVGGVGWQDPVVDLASHHLDLLGWLLDSPPGEIEARPGRLRARWPDGSELRGTYAVGPPVDTVVLSDGSGSIAIDRLRGTRLRGTGQRRGSAVLPDPGLLRARLARGAWERSFEYALAAFLRSIRDGRIASPGVDEGLQAVAVGEATLRSLERGTVEQV